MRMRTLTGALCFAAVACSSPSELDDSWAVPENITYAPVLEVDLASMERTESGLYWKDLAPGDGDTAEVGENVRVDYTAWLPDGTQVERQVIELKPLGYGLYIRAFDEGIVGMRVNGVRQLVAPPSMAWGRRGNPDFGVPPLATLVFRIERLTDVIHSN